MKFGQPPTLLQVDTPYVCVDLQRILYGFPMPEIATLILLSCLALWFDGAITFAMEVNLADRA